MVLVSFDNGDIEIGFYVDHVSGALVLKGDDETIEIPHEEATEILNFIGPKLKKYDPNR